MINLLQIKFRTSDSELNIDYLNICLDFINNICN